MERQIRRLGWAFLAMFLALMLQVNYLQVLAADDLANHPANGRLLIQEYEIERGQILARDRQTVLATSQPTEGRYRYLRQYPNGTLYAHITGYYSIRYGRSGLEQSFNEYLSGRAEELLPQRLVDEILGRPRRGASLVTTVDPVLQLIAQQELGGDPGAVVAIEPRTGEVLALVSIPAFDANRLASHDLDVADEAWRQLNAGEGKPLVPKASQELYPPGSTFKLVTAAAALESGMRPEDTIANPRTYTPPQTTNEIENFGGSHCLGGAPQITLAQAFQVSCNVSFAMIGVQEIGAERLVGQAERFGLNGDVDFDVPFAEGRIPPPDSFRDDQPGLAFSAIGQQSVAMNPLHMALVAGAIANDGVALRPRLVREIRDPSGRVVQTFDPQAYSQAVSPETAEALTRMMVATVDEGTAQAAQIPGVEVAGKTGTAQHGQGGNPHAWFVAFAPAADPVIAVAVVVLNGGSLGSEATGGRVAAPIAKAIIEAALAR